MMTSSNRKDYLSKSLFIRGLQCHKSLYLDRYNPELKDEMPPSKEALFESGHEVGRMAQNLFPGGVEIPYEGLSHKEQLEMTQSEIKKGTTTLYEATFSYNGVFIKVDILHKNKRGWDMYEVKGSTEIKDNHPDDVAIQYYVMKGSGLPISKVFLVHINNTYIRDGEIEVDKLFTMNDLTEIVKGKQSYVEKEIRKQRKMLAGTEPDIDIGPHCDDPYACDFKGHCWSHIPEDSIFDLRGRMDARFFLYEKGILSMYDVPQECLSADQFIQVEANRNKQIHYDHDAVKAFIESLWYPMYFLDFETFWPVIPPFDGLRPYEQIPFQYSLHYLEKDGDELKHHEYLAMPRTDPREELVKKLIAEISENACVLAYSKGFESRILKSLASWFPEYAEKIDTIIGNMRDLMDLFRRKDIYHWQQGGSYSLKDVLPVMVPELSYENLAIQDGGMATDAYTAMNLSNDPEEVERIRESLLEYCRLDTLAMVKILEIL